MQHSARCNQQVLICSCCLFIAEFFSKSFLCRNSTCLSSGAIGIDPGYASGLFLNSCYPDKFNANTVWEVQPGLLAVSRDWCFERFLDGILSLEKHLHESLYSALWILLAEVESALLALQCVLNKRGHLLRQITMSTIFLNLLKSANRGASGSHEIFCWWNWNLILNAAQGAFTSVLILTHQFNHRVLLGSSGILWLITRACFCLSFPGF